MTEPSPLPHGSSPLHHTSRRHQVTAVTRLLDGWSPIDRVRYRQTFSDGTVEVHDRDLNARGDGVTSLLHCPARGTVLLLRQPRIVATLRGDSTGETLEACSGLLEHGSPEACARAEIREETGYEAVRLTPVGAVYSSPGSSLELVYLFIAEYTEEGRTAGGGLRHEGEEIEVVELPFREALALMRQGTIRDARTMLLLQHLALQQLAPQPG